MTAVPVAAEIDAHEILESGNVLIIPDAPVELKAEDLAFILRIRQTGNHHKNIAYKPDRDRISGLDQAAAPVCARLRAGLHPRKTGRLEPDAAPPVGAGHAWPAAESKPG